jgi:membrane fusion protein (multidrug efflux system)
MPPALVAVQEVTPRTIPVEFEYPAQTAGSREVEVRSRVPGILLKRNYEEGSVVRAGQSLFTVDSAQYEAAAARAGGRRGRGRGAPLEREPPHQAPQAALRGERGLAEGLRRRCVGRGSRRGGPQSARARLDEARLNIGYTKVESPISGISSRALKSEGTLLAGPQDLLTTVNQVDPIYVNFGLSEAEQGRLQRDAAQGKLTVPKDMRFEVAIKFEDGRVYSRPGRLAFSDVRVNNATGTSDARAEVPNPAGEVRPGQFVRVILRGAQRPNAITVPQRAVMEGPQGKLVYVVGAGNKAEPRPIVVGEWAGNDWVVLSGLNAGEKVITEGLVKVFPGAPVQVGDPNAAPGKGGPPPKGEAAKPSDKKK